MNEDTTKSAEELAREWGVPVEDVKRRLALEEILPGCPLSHRFGLKPEEAMRQAAAAVDKLRLLADAELQTGLFDNDVLGMIFRDGAYRASLIYARAKEELEGTRRP